MRPRKSFGKTNYLSANYVFCFNNFGGEFDCESSRGESHAVENFWERLKKIETSPKNIGF